MLRGFINMIHASPEPIKRNMYENTPALGLFTAAQQESHQWFKAYLKGCCLIQVQFFFIDRPLAY